jgi:NADH-quinone oxidoreductase subunit C
VKPLEELKQDIESKVSGANTTVDGSSLIVPKEKWTDVAKFLKSDASYAMDYLSCVTGTDYKEHLEVVYTLYSIEKKEGPLNIKVRTDTQTSEIPSATPIWRSAEFQEREAFDLVGVRFIGHPDLRRILMWDGFEHHPLRKDYQQEDQDRPQEQF